MRRIIQPIVYEDNAPAKIRAAFKAGCGGVIVDGTVPEAVTAEIARIATNPERFLSQRDSIALSATDEKSTQRRWSFDLPTLRETCCWLEEEYTRTAAAGLCPSGLNGGGRSSMSLWFNDEQHFPWHVDKKQQHLGFWPDMHIHIYGAGLVVAAPPRSLTLTFNDKSNSPRLLVNGDTFDDVANEHLKDRGCTFLTLQPGQRIYFDEGCLHRSAFSPPAALKMRAAIF
jgi:hypothetical protein